MSQCLQMAARQSLWYHLRGVYPRREAEREKLDLVTATWMVSAVILVKSHLCPLFPTVPMAAPFQLSDLDGGRH